MLNIFSILWSDFKAWKKGERRIAPRNQRGRVYEPAPHKSNIKITAKVTRKNGEIKTYNLTEGT